MTNFYTIADANVTVAILVRDVLLSIYELKIVYF